MPKFDRLSKLTRPLNTVFVMATDVLLLDSRMELDAAMQFVPSIMLLIAVLKAESQLIFVPSTANICAIHPSKAFDKVTHQWSLS